MPHRMPRNLPDGVRSTAVSSVTAAGGIGPYWARLGAGNRVSRGANKPWQLLGCAHQVGKQRGGVRRRRVAHRRGGLKAQLRATLGPVHRQQHKVARDACDADASVARAGMREESETGRAEARNAGALGAVANAVLLHARRCVKTARLCRSDSQLGSARRGPASGA